MQFSLDELEQYVDTDPKEQEEIANKIIEILDLDDKNSIILYDLDNDVTLHQ